MVNVMATELLSTATHLAFSTKANAENTPNWRQAMNGPDKFTEKDVRTRSKLWKIAALSLV